MKCLNLIVILLAIFTVQLSKASTMGSDGIYYTAVSLREACHKHFPNLKNKTDAGYNRWVSENQEAINTVKSSQGYEKYLMINKLLVNSAIDKREISKKKLKSKCSKFYENLTSN